MKPCFRFISVLLGFLLLSNRWSFAQRGGYTIPSVEWLTAAANTVVLASVARTVAIPPPVINPLFERSKTIITLNVRETIKGQPKPTIQFVINEPDGRVDGWQKARSEHVWFLKVNPMHAGENELENGPVERRFSLMPLDGAPFVIAFTPQTPQEKAYSFNVPPIFSMNLDVLVETGQILEAIRAATRFEQTRIGLTYSHRIPVDIRWVGMTPADGGDMLTVPVDARLETLAREMILMPYELLDLRGDSPGKRIAKEQNDQYFAEQLAKATSDTERSKIETYRASQRERGANQLRASGAEALRYFKSERNIAILNLLLTDDAFEIVHMSDQPDAKRVYHVRKAAYETLRAWDIVMNDIVIEARYP